MQIVLWIALACGHIGIWCFVFNRALATACPRGWRKMIEGLVILLTALPLLGIPLYAISQGFGTVAETAASSVWLTGWFLGCVAACGWFATTWLERICSLRPPAEIRLIEARRRYPEQELGRCLTAGWVASLLRWIPGNQVVQLSIEERQIDLSRGEAASSRSDRKPLSEGTDNPGQMKSPDGGRFPQPADRGIGGALPAEEIRVVQLSDLHFTGQVCREYFEYAIARAREFEPDLVFLTGDLVDEPECLEWIAGLFAGLKAPYGVWYVLGNHDRRIDDTPGLRSQLARAGLQQASGRWHELEIRGARVVLTGNELPWYADAKELPVRTHQPGETVILLSHSPDQIVWAAERGCQLVFAGHTHGGQIRLPVVGPIVAPSRYGVRYASGDFRVGKVLMHVSRGLSGDDPIRWGCPPELGFFRLRLPAARAGRE